MLTHLRRTDLFHTRIGRGVPVLVMHGGLGLDHTYLRPWLDPLSDACDITYYDHRGNGRSADPDSWETVGHDSWVRDADALRAMLGHERIVVLGHSYGSLLAQEYALAYPDRVAALVLCATAPALDYSATVLANLQCRGTPEIVEAAMKGLTTPVPDDAAFRRLWLTLLPLYFRAYDRERAENVFRETRYRAAAFNRANFHCAPRFSTLDRLASIQAPTLVLSGAHDWIMPAAEGGERVAAGIPGARHVVLQESGHFPFVEEREQFLHLVSAWLEDVMD